MVIDLPSSLIAPATLFVAGFFDSLGGSRWVVLLGYVFLAAPVNDWPSWFLLTFVFLVTKVFSSYARAIE